MNQPRPLRAATVSGQLRRAGFNPIGSGSRREGLKVSGSTGGRVSVAASFDVDWQAHRMAASAKAVLVELGYEVEVNPHSDAILYVSRKDS